MGRRVAKKFPDNPDDEGETIHRATVASVDTGKSIDQDWYMLLYDDGDIEECQVRFSRARCSYRARLRAY